MATDTRPRYAADDLRELTRAIFASFGIPQADAELGATVLVDADLAGIESHGIAHLPWHPGYAPGLARGIVKATPEVAGGSGAALEVAAVAIQVSERGNGPVR